MLLQIFISFLFLSAIGSLIVLAITLIKPFTKKIFSASWHYYTLLAVIVMMLVPVHIHIPMKVLDAKETGHTYTAEQSHTEEHTALNTEALTVNVTRNDYAPKTAFMQKTGKYIGLFAVVWALIVTVKLICLFISYSRFIRKLEHTCTPVSCPLLSEYTRRNVRVLHSENPGTPFTTGILRPILVLPDTYSDFHETRLRYILAHEATHINRYDSLFKLLVAIAKCVHWFNPAMHLICKAAENECEISCDYAVVRNMDTAEENSYINTIIYTLCVNNESYNNLTTGLSGKAKILKRRFAMIKNKTKVTRTAAVISAIAAICLLCTGVFASGMLSDTYSPKDSIQATDKTDASSSSDASVFNSNEDTTEPSTHTAVSAVILETADASYIWPCDSTSVSAPFTPERNHYAVDIAAEKGSNVYAPLSATVIKADFDFKDGNRIELVSGDTTIYLAHMSELCVSVGDTVNLGDVIGKVGNTGMSTGPHLHYSVSIDGEYQDPLTLDTVKLTIE